MGLLSGMLAATAYLQVTALGRVGEPGERIVFYFSAAGMVAGAGLAAFTDGGLHATTCVAWPCCWRSGCWRRPRNG